MGIGKTDLRDILTKGPDGYELHEVGRGGRINVYRGRSISAFLARADERRHEHKVYDPSGRLVYHRDHNGKVLVGTMKQMKDSDRKEMLGRTAVSAGDILRESWDRALRWNGLRR